MPFQEDHSHSEWVAELKFICAASTKTSSTSSASSPPWIFLQASLPMETQPIAVAHRTTDTSCAKNRIRLNPLLPVTSSIHNEYTQRYPTSPSSLSAQVPMVRDLPHLLLHHLSSTCQTCGSKGHETEVKEAREGGGVGQNVPLEVVMFMSSWIAAIQRRKTVDAPTITSLLAALSQLSEALSGLERILTTPIPFSYNAHVWEVTWVCCSVFPFQLYGSGFGWVTVPATMVSAPNLTPFSLKIYLGGGVLILQLTAYIVVGFAAIGEEIENPFGYDKNDLDLDFFVSNIIAQEMQAIISRPFAGPESWVFIWGMPTSEQAGLGRMSCSIRVWTR